MADLAVTPTTFIPKKVGTGQLAIAGAELYAVPADKVFKLCSIVLANDTTAPATATLNFGDNAAAAGDTNIICKNMTIPPCIPVILDFGPNGFYLNATDDIRGSSSADTQITYHISGVEESA